MTIEDVLAQNEFQSFDRKSIQISATSLSDTICAFANADGGTIAIGISDKTRRIEGVDGHIEKLNDLLRAPIDYCNPSVPVETEMIRCTNYKGQKDHVLLMKIDASPLLHVNHADEAFLRVGDKSKKLSFQDRLTLIYAKGLRYYEDEPVHDASMDDLDMDFVRQYVQKIGYHRSPEEYLTQNKRFAAKKEDGTYSVSTAAVLLFGRYPQQFFPRARIRFIRYEGTEEKTGPQMNVIKDVVFEGRILDQVKAAVSYIQTQMKEKTYLGSDGVFVTKEEYGEFVRTELVVNAVTHRDYAIKGTEIQIKMFDDRLEVDSPGTFPGMVKKDNIRYTHFSRNPKIAAFLKDYGYVKEYGEGVDRMCVELEALGLPDPEFDASNFILRTTVRSASYYKVPTAVQESGDSVKNPVIGAEKTGDSCKKPVIGIEKTGDSNKKPVIASQNAAHKLVPLETILAICDKNHYTQPTIKNITDLYKQIEVNQIFSSAYIQKVLSCASSTAGSLMQKLREMKVVIAVSGKGKGKYRLKYESEFK